MSVIENITPAQFDERLSQAPLEPFAIECYGNQCAACTVLERLLGQMIQAGELDVPLFKLNVDEHPEFAQRFGVRGLPTLIAVKPDASTQSLLAMPNRSALQQFFQGSRA
jgi:thioredoxin 1